MMERTTALGQLLALAGAGSLALGFDYDFGDDSYWEGA